MSKDDSWIHRFVSHLESLRDQEDRGALAALRRGLGSEPGTTPAMYPHILPWAPSYKHAESVCYIVAALFALHPAKGGAGNMGKAFWLIPDRTESLERRFVALLNCHRDDLPKHLRQAISLLKSKDISVDWRQLTRDILNWDHESRFVQQQWARQYWGSKEQSAEAEEKKMATT